MLYKIALDIEQAGYTEIGTTAVNKEGQSINFDYSKIADGKALETNIILQSGDTIVVP